MTWAIFNIYTILSCLWMARAFGMVFSILLTNLYNISPSRFQLLPSCSSLQRICGLRKSLLQVHGVFNFMLTTNDALPFYVMENAIPLIKKMTTSDDILFRSLNERLTQPQMIRSKIWWAKMEKKNKRIFPHLVLINLFNH